MIGFGPLAGAFAGRAAKEVVKRVLNGYGTEAELRKAEIDLSIIDAQAAIGQRSARPFLQYVAGFVLITYLIATAGGALWNTFVADSVQFDWTQLYTEGYLLIGWAITYTTGIGGLRSLEKRSGESENHSVADKFSGALENIRGKSRAPANPVVTNRTELLRPVVPVRHSSAPGNNHAFGKSSEKHLAQSDRDIARVHRTALTLLPENVDMSLICSLRSFAGQRENINNGVSWTMDSRHLERPLAKAIDHVPLALQSDGSWDSDWSWDAFTITTNAIKQAAQIEGVACTYGIDWKGRKRDGAHTELDRDVYPYERADIELS